MLGLLAPLKNSSSIFKKHQGRKMKVKTSDKEGVDYIGKSC